jgi:hypothetical protein
VKRLAADRSCWKSFVAALCSSTGDDRKWWWWWIVNNLSNKSLRLIRNPLTSCGVTRIRDDMIAEIIHNSKQYVEVAKKKDLKSKLRKVTY